MEKIIKILESADRDEWLSISDIASAARMDLAQAGVALARLFFEERVGREYFKGEAVYQIIRG